MSKKVNNIIYVSFSTNKTNGFVEVESSISPSDIRWFAAEGEIEQPVFENVQEGLWEHM